MEKTISWNKGDGNINISCDTEFANYGNVLDIVNSLSEEEKSNYRYSQYITTKLDGDYFDIPEKKLRIMQINYSDHNGAHTPNRPEPDNLRSRSALNLMLSTLPDDYRAILFTHGYDWNASDTASPFPLILPGYWAASNYCNKIKQLKFVLAGHKHNTINTSSSMTNGSKTFNLLELTRSCDLGYNKAGNTYDLMYVKTIAKKTFDAQFTVVQVDFTNSKVYTVNVGYLGSYYDGVSDFYDNSEY